jgi:hypothetical protein
MKRSMSRQAEAERERRAQVIAAEGEFQASTKLSQAAGTMAATPGALQLRLLQTIVEVAADKNTTLVMPFPVEIVRFLDHHTPPVASEATASGPSTSRHGGSENSMGASPGPSVSPELANGSLMTAS